MSVACPWQASWSRGHREPRGERRARRQVAAGGLAQDVSHYSLLPSSFLFSSSFLPFSFSPPPYRRGCYTGRALGNMPEESAVEGPNLPVFQQSESTSGRRDKPKFRGGCHQCRWDSGQWCRKRGQGQGKGSKRA